MKDKFADGPLIHLTKPVLFEEIASLMTSLSRLCFSEHEGSRRMKTELLVQLDGLAKSDDLVFLLAASNLPW